MANQPNEKLKGLIDQARDLLAQDPTMPLDRLKLELSREVNPRLRLDISVDSG
jgi:hypothetical protein